MTKHLVLHGALTAVPVERWEGKQFSQPVSAGLGISGLIGLLRPGR